MNIKLPNKNQAKSWEYLPDTNTLLQYLYKEDLIELSQCCKCYRSQLERDVLEQIHLDTHFPLSLDHYYELRSSNKLVKVLGFLKSDLDSKLKFINKVTLSNDIQIPFANEFNILLPNIKTLIINGDCYENSVGLGLITILKGMENLEVVKLNNISGPIKDFSTKRKIFPKSIKSLEVCGKAGYIFNDGPLEIYDNIDNYYTNLYSLSVVTNRMLKNLSCGMPNLREVEIKAAHSLKISSIAAFLNANPQLVKLITNFTHYDEKILQIILSLKYLEHWSIHYGHWEGVKVYNLPSNYSVKFLKFHGSIPAPLTYQFINSCKNLEILELKRYYKLNYLNWSKFERKIPILRIYRENFNRKTIKTVDSSRKFNFIQIEKNHYVNERIDNYSTNTFINYKLIPSNAKFYALKFIN